MGAFTKLFNLFKPDYTDKPDIVKAVAENMDKIDAAIGGKQNDLGIKNIGDNLTLDPNTGVLDAKAQKITVDTALSATSGNPIANKAVNTEITNLGSRIDTLDNNLTKHELNIKHGVTRNVSTITKDTNISIKVEFDNPYNDDNYQVFLGLWVEGSSAEGLVNYRVLSKNKNGFSISSMPKVNFSNGIYRFFWLTIHS